MTKNIKTILKQAFLDHLMFPFLKNFISNLPEKEKEEALSISVEKFNQLALKHPEWAGDIVNELQKIIPDGEPLETFVIDPQLPSGEGKS